MSFFSSHPHFCQPDISSYSSVASSPFSNTPAAFYIGGGSYTPSEGGNLIGVGEEIPFEVSPPFQIPCVGLLSTSPSTGPGSSLALLRDHLIGSNKLAPHGKSQDTHFTNTTADVVSLLPELPESPFDCFAKDDSNLQAERDSGSLLGGAADTECIFACDESERGDDAFDDGELDDMPFALSQTPTDSFLLQKSTNSEDNSESPFSKQHQSIIAQQCLAPPVLTGFEKDTLDEVKVLIDFSTSL